MLAELLFLHVEARYLKAASGKLNLTPAARLKVHIKYRDFVKSTITSLVAAQWKTINGTLSATREQLKKGIAKVLVPARKAKDTVSEKVSEKTAPVVDPLRNNLLAPAMQPLSRAVAKALVAVYSRFAAGFQRACDAFVAAASAPGADVELCERRFAVDVAQPGTLRECFEELNKLAELCSNVSSVLPDSVQKLLGSRLKMLDTGFDASGYIRRQERAVLNLADAAAYTFAESFKTAPDRRPATVTALREDTLKRFYVEAADNVADGTQDFCADAVDDVFALRVLDACGPLVSGLDSLIPAHVRQFISVRGCLEAVLSALVASAAKTATEKVMQEKELVKF